MRGEKFGDAKEIAALVGSPPHARGKAAIRPALLPDQRITPACAGKRC